MRGAERNTLLTVQHSPSACSPSRSICVGASRVWESQGNGSGSRSGVLAALLCCHGRLVLQHGRSGVLAVHLDDVGQYAQ